MSVKCFWAEISCKLWWIYFHCIVLNIVKKDFALKISAIHISRLFHIYLAIYITTQCRILREKTYIFIYSSTAPIGASLFLNFRELFSKVLKDRNSIFMINGCHWENIIYKKVWWHGPLNLFQTCINLKPSRQLIYWPTFPQSDKINCPY